MNYLQQVHLSIQDISIANRNFIFVAINEALEDYRIQMDWPRYDKLVLLSLRAISVDTNISECSFLLTATRSLLSRTLEINNRSYINFLCLPPSFHLLLSNQGARITSDAIDMLINIFMGKILENFDHNVKRLAPFLRLSTQIPANNPHDFRQILDHYNQKSARDLNALLENYIERKSLSSQFSVLAELPDINTNAHRLKDIYKHLFEAVKLKNVEEDKIKFLNYIKIALDAMLGISRSRKPSLCAQPWGSIAQLLVQLGPCNALDQFIGSSLLCGVDINTESDMFPERSKIRALASTAKLQEFNPHLYHVQFPISRYFDAWDAIIDQLSKSEMLYILYYSSFMGISHFNILSSFQSKSLLILCDVKNPPLTSKQLALLLWTMIKMKVPINELPDRVRSCLVENIVDSATRVSKTFN